MSDWIGPTPIAQQYPNKPTDGIGQLVGIIKDQGTKLREVTSNLLRSMGVRARPGQMSSLDYDGTSHAALGTAGWALASDSGGPSYLALNGIDVYADLAAKTATLAATVTNLAARVAQTATITSFNTGSLPNDSTFHDYGSPISITIAVPTGRLIVTVGCGEATLNAGGNSVIADATFSISGGVASMGDFGPDAYLASASTIIGVPLSTQRAFTVTPGTYTVTGQMRAWAAGTATASVNFQQPFLTVQVTG